jgi:hypothetical protein
LCHPEKSKQVYDRVMTYRNVLPRAILTVALVIFELTSPSHARSTFGGIYGVSTLEPGAELAAKLDKDTVNRHALETIPSPLAPLINETTEVMSHEPVWLYVDVDDDGYDHAEIVKEVVSKELVPVIGLHRFNLPETVMLSYYNSAYNTADVRTITLKPMLTVLKPLLVTTFFFWGEIGLRLFEMLTYLMLLIGLQWIARGFWGRHKLRCSRSLRSPRSIFVRT